MADINTRPRFRFTIRVKLLLLSIAILTLPYIAYEYMREMEYRLRSNLETSLLDTAKAIATSLHQSYRQFPDRQTAVDPTLFIHKIETPMQTDGYLDDWVQYLDWSEVYPQSFADDAGNITEPVAFRLVAGIHENTLHILLRIRDDQTIYHKPDSETIIDSDHVILVIGDDYVVKERYYLAPSVPGMFNPFQIETVEVDWIEKKFIRYKTNIVASWQPSQEGYDLEIALPLNLVHERLGIMVADTDKRGTQIDFHYTGTAGKNTLNRPGRVILPDNYLETLITRLHSSPGRRIWVLDSRGQVLANSGSLKQDFKKHPLNLFYKLVLPPVTDRFKDDLAGASRLYGEEIRSALRGNAGSRWRSSPDKKAVIVSAAAPVWVFDEIRGVVVAEETTNNIQLLQRDALVGLVNRTLLLFFIITLLLLFFASRLSVRLRRLSREAATAIDEYGRVVGDMPVSQASDEIGDLSRNYAAILERLRQYNHYLEGMAGKLSHELRTPMAVVQSSLDNLDSDIETDKQVYIERARDGIQRLNTLVTRLSEAARLEQALQGTEKVRVNICELLTQAIDGYRLAYAPHPFELNLPPIKHVMNIAPDLFMQMIDKLVSNAVDFSVPDKPVIISLHTDGADSFISIVNRGPLLPEEMKGELFNSMVSVRDKDRKGSPHLGLGLYIARIIAEFHNGTIIAENLADSSGVCFRINFRQ